MRVVCNLASGIDKNDDWQINTIEKLRKSIEFISDLDSHNVYESLFNLYDPKKINYKDDDPFAFSGKCNEEIIKAKKIFEDKTGTWEKKIKKAEEYAFFYGSIRFLYQNDKRRENWGLFSKKMKKVAKCFDEVAREDEELCLKEDVYKNHPAKLLKELFNKFNKSNIKILWNDILYKNNGKLNNWTKTWRYYLAESKICGPIHLFLTETGGNLESARLSSDFDKKPWEATLKIFFETHLLDSLLINDMSKTQIKELPGDDSYIAIFSVRNKGPQRIKSGAFVVLDKRYYENSKYKYQFFKRKDIKINWCAPDTYANGLYYGNADIYFTYHGDYFVWREDGSIHMYYDNCCLNEKEYVKFNTIKNKNNKDNRIIKNAKDIINGLKKMKSERNEKKDKEAESKKAEAKRIYKLKYNFFITKKRELEVMDYDLSYVPQQEFLHKDYICFKYGKNNKNNFCLFKDKISLQHKEGLWWDGESDDNESVQNSEGRDFSFSLNDNIKNIEEGLNKLVTNAKKLHAKI